MCTVELVQVLLQHDEAYEYGQEYADDKKVKRSKQLRPNQTPWEAMCALYPFCDMGNKENPSFSPVRYAPPCAEILVLYSVWDAPGPVLWHAEEDDESDAEQEDNRFQIVTLWDREEDRGQLLKENLQQGCPWLFNANCTDETNTRRLCADDAIEIRTLKRHRPPQRPAHTFDLRGLRASLHTL